MKNKADKAIIMAAGLGTRLRPATEHTPKPLVKVNGKRMIETVIDALHNNGIKEIYVVTGYLKEKFSVLLDEYEDVVLIENPYYNTCNNISSLYAAREHLGNCIIMDGDQIIYNEKILNPEFEQSGYCSTWINEFKNEWIQHVNDQDIVTECMRDGGDHGWQLFGVSFWTQEDGDRLRDYLELEFEKNKNRQIFWDDIALFVHKEDFRLKIRRINKGDIIEVDQFSELVELDASYKL